MTAGSLPTAGDWMQSSSLKLAQSPNRLQEAIEKRRGSMGSGDSQPVEDRGRHDAVVKKLLAAGANVDSVTKARPLARRALRARGRAASCQRRAPA